jgi:putative FmdB family regulatory protein
MPTYEYACTACGHQLEAVQSFTDDPLTVCPDCKGALRKVYGNVGISFKGSGFYKNDSRSEGKAKRTSAAGSESSSSGESSTSTTTETPAKSDSTPSTKADSSTPAKTETAKASTAS